MAFSNNPGIIHTSYFSLPLPLPPLWSSFILKHAVYCCSLLSQDSHLDHGRQMVCIP